MKAKGFVVVALALGFLLVQGHSVQAQKKGIPFALMYSNNINGEVDPCPT